MNSVYIDSAVAATPIYIGPNNASSIIIGNTNCSTIIDGDFRVSTINSINPTSDLLIANLQTSGILNIGTSSSRTAAINIGNSENTVNINGSLAMGTGRNITLQPNTNYIPPSVGQLGLITGGSAFPTGAQSATFTASTIAIPTSGIYMISFWSEAAYTAAPTSIYNTIGWSTNIQSGRDFLGSSNAFGYIVTSTTLRSASSFPMNITSTGNVILTVTMVGAITTFKGFFVATRIA